MKVIAKTFALIISLSFVLSRPASAYDEDTHLRMTYAAARFVGINHEVALMLAMGSAWNDVSALTTPMGSLVIGTRLRRLFHFPSSRSLSISNVQVHGDGSFNIITKGGRLDPMGSELIIDGMRQGNLIMVGNGIHTLQDTSGHEGFSAELGHAYAGHEPDRPWRDMKKYEDMTLNVITAMLSIRKLLPPEALDYQSLKDRNLWKGGINSESSAETLAAEFLQHVRPMVSNDIFKDFRYTRPGTKYVLQRLQGLGFINQGVDLESLVKDEYFDGSKDIHEIFLAIVHDVSARELKSESIMNQKMLLNDVLTGYMLENDKNVFQQLADKFPERVRENIAIRIVTQMLEHYVPDRFGTSSLGFSNSFVYEPNNKLRELEMNLRMDDWRQLTNQMFGRDWHFEHPGPSLTRIAFQKLLQNPVTVFFRLVRGGIRTAKDLIIKNTVDKELLDSAESELEKQVLEFGKLSSETELVAMPKDLARRWVFTILTFTWFDMLKLKFRFKPDNNAMAWASARGIEELLEKGEVNSLVGVDEVFALVEKVKLKAKKLPKDLVSRIVDAPDSVIRCQRALGF